MRNALIRYRIMAYLVGCLLVVLVCVGLPLKYLGNDSTVVTWTAIPHGYLYMILLITAVDLGRRAKWTWKRLILIALAGTIPFLSFVAERSATKDVRAKLAAAAARTPRARPSRLRNAPLSSIRRSIYLSIYCSVGDLIIGRRCDRRSSIGGELDGDLALDLAQIDPHPGLQVVGQPVSQLLGLGRDELRLPASARPAVASGLPQRDQLLDGPDGQTLGHDPLGDAAPGRPGRRWPGWPERGRRSARRPRPGAGRSPGSRSSRMVLEICGRERLIRPDSSSWVQPKSSSICW